MAGLAWLVLVKQVQSLLIASVAKFSSVLSASVSFWLLCSLQMLEEDSLEYLMKSCLQLGIRQSRSGPAIDKAAKVSAEVKVESKKES